MGYTTKFSGKLLFNHDLPISAIQKLRTILGEDCREHPEWGRTDLTYIDLKIADELDGLEWDGSEKTYDLPEKVNLVIRLMHEAYPNFVLTGELLAQGEDIDDRWKLRMVANVAKSFKFDPTDNEKRFIVVCESWDYNDEYYHQPADEGYTLYEPKLYTKEEADSLYQNLNYHSSSRLTRWDDNSDMEVKIQPYKVIKLNI